MLVLDPGQSSIAHETIPDLLKYLSDRPLILFNNTRVLPARLPGKNRQTGKRVELLLVEERTPATWAVLVKGLARLKIGQEFVFGDGSLTGTFLGAHNEMGMFRLESAEPLQMALERFGHIPLPHYIERGYSDPGQEQLDRERYQTVFASNPGAIAAPTAGLHFTESFLKQMSEHAELAYLTLHVGVGTFQPIRTEEILDHTMHKEYYQIPAETWNAILKAKEEGRPVMAVGTTTTRVLESVEITTPRDRVASGWTDCFLYPGKSFRNVDRMLTNFHLPRSTLLLLVCAFAGKDPVFKAYKEAIREEYRFFSYGDAMLIL